MFVAACETSVLSRDGVKPLTTRVYTFEKLCIGGFLYVDKTAGIHELMEPAFARY